MKALRRELAIETTILRLVIAVLFLMLAPKIVYPKQPVSAALTAVSGDAHAHAAAHPDIRPWCKARANVVILLPKKN